MMFQDSWKPKEIIIALFALALVLFVYGAIPFLMHPALGIGFWAVGFSQSLANGSLFDFYAHDVGIPKPAAIAFGLAGAWPASLLIRAGIHAADAYTVMAALWLGLAMFSAYRIARWFGGAKLTALALAVVWMTMPIIWGHVGYTMLSLGIALLSFYFLAAIKLFLINSEALKISTTSIALYAISAIVSVFMDGYTFMMFASGSSILLLYMLLTRADIRPQLLKVAAPVHVVSFALAYALYCFYIGKQNFAAQPIDLFRATGLDLSFLAIPSKGVLWIPDLLGISVRRSMELYFADGSVWSTTFALPVLILGLLSWWRTRRFTKISTGILLVSMFAFYMALGPSLKINSVKPEALRSQIDIVPYSQYQMASEYALAPTGNAWISERLPGFNVMRASYRWSALGIFALWLLIVICISRGDKKDSRVLLSLLPILFLLNLPNPEQRWINGVRNRSMFQQVDQELVEELRKSIRKNETVAFLPWGNDFMVNYLAPKVGFRTFNIGGDKNLADAKSQWPQAMKFLPGDEIDASRAISSLKLLIDGSADAIILPYFSMRWSSYNWPCSKGSPICPSERRADLQPIITALRVLSYVDVVETDLFATVRLRPEEIQSEDFWGQMEPASPGEKLDFGSSGKGVHYLQAGWSDPEDWGTWSASRSATVLFPASPAQVDSVVIDFSAAISPSHPVQRVDIFVNGSQAFSGSISEGSGTLEFKIPDAAKSDAFKGITMEFRLPDAASPKDIGLGEDMRTLAIGLRTITLTER